MKKIVLTGGPCSGKTSVIRELEKRGFNVLQETAKEIVAARRHILMTKEESDIRQKLIFNEQFAKEKNAEKNNFELLFLDRSLIDGLAYSLLYSGEDSVKKYLPFVEKQKYDSVFVLELLPFNSEGFRAGNETEEEARKIHESIIKTYKSFGYEPIIVPVMPIKERVEFILKNISNL